MKNRWLNILSVILFTVTVTPAFAQTGQEDYWDGVWGAGYFGGQEVDADDWYYDYYEPKDNDALEDRWHENTSNQTLSDDDDAEWDYNYWKSEWEYVADDSGDDDGWF